MARALRWTTSFDFPVQSFMCIYRHALVYLPLCKAMLSGWRHRSEILAIDQYWPKRTGVSFGSRQQTDHHVSACFTNVSHLPG